jgi:hypothetical protein
MTFFISYTNRTENDKAWADWLEWYLRRITGADTIIQKYDFKSGSNIVTNIHNALKESDIVICVLTNAYLTSEYCAEEWSNAKELRLIKFDDCKPDGWLTRRAYIDLNQLDENSAMAKLNNEMMLPSRSDTKPPFPSSSVTSKPAFPVFF